MVFDGDAMGARFWVKVIVIAVVAAIAAMLAVLLISSAFVAWGLFGGFLALAVVLILLGWITDRRRAATTGP